MKTKKILLGLGLSLLGSFGFAQNGLEGVIVEKYYVSNAADAAGSVGTLPVGSVTYRIYADMLPNYKFQVLYGVPTHPLNINTTTTWFNAEDRGATTSNGVPRNQLLNNSNALDSWFSVGGAGGAGASGTMGVLKTADNGASNYLPIAGNPMLKNADPSAGIALNVQDGMIAGSPEAITFVGLTTELDQFDALAGVGGSFTTSNGSIASLNGSLGVDPTGTNRVLIGQFTTTGVFQFELNIQIGTPTGGTQNYVSSNPVGAEISIPSLTRVANTPPTVSITAPANGANIITGTNVTITANATDVSGIAQVEFFDGATSLGVDATSPYSVNWTATVGAHNLTAVATDADGTDPLSATSAIVAVTVANNQAPTISVSAAASAVVGDAVAISSTTNDVDGTVASVEFFVDNVSIGVDNAAPFTASWLATLGNHSIKGTATDNLGLTATSATISISVVNNIPPTAAITAPNSSATYTAPQPVTIDAAATDADGTVTQVEFFVNNVSVGVDATSPYQFVWTSVIGAASLTVKSTDNRGAITTSAAVNLSIADPNALPYAVVTTTQTCLPTTFCIPVRAMNAVDNVIGYDVVMNFDPNKVTPTGVVTVAGALINSSYVDVSQSIGAGVMNISAYFNSNAPANAEFNGTGDIFCVEFTKTANFASVDTSVISVSSLQESYIIGVTPKLTSSGKYITYKDSLYTATLQYWGAGSNPILYNAANPNDYLVTNIYGNSLACGNQSLVAVQPNLTGQFTYNIWNGEAVNIQRDILATTSVQPVVNGADALLVRRLLVNDPSFVPSVHQAIAMDVNLDGAISAGDVSQINQRAVLSIPEFKQAWNYTSGGVSNGQPSKDWLFVDSTRIATNPAYAISATFPLDNGVGFSKYRVPAVPFCLPVTVTGYFTCPLLVTETFKGIMLGEINGNFKTIANDGLIKGTESDKVVFDLTHAVINGNTIDVPVSVVSTTNVNALDFSMMFNEGNLTYNSIVNHSSNIQALDNLNANDKTLRFTSNSIQNYNISNAIVSVRFTMLNGTISASDLNSVVGYINGNQVGVEVLDGTTATGITANTNDNLIAIYPNPTTGLLNVVVPENATVQLLDVSGKQVILQTNVNANEKHEMSVENVANGIYMMKIFNNNFVSMKKVVINK